MKKILKVLRHIFINLNIITLGYKIFWIFPVKKNKIVFITMNKKLSDSPKYILKNLQIREKYSLVLLGESNTNEKGYKSVRYGSLKSLYELATSKIWVSNTRLPLFIRKRKSQVYFQTWHSPLRLKKIEFDAEEYLDSYYVKTMINDSKMIDYMLTGCKFSEDVYRRAFRFNKEILKVGTPRCDVFFNKNKCDGFRGEICKKYNIDPQKKIILYAPTFRDNIEAEKYLLDYKKLAQKIGDKYVILGRMHNRSNVRLGDDIIDVSKYPDMQELLCASDILITDYSSCMFDMLIANKICILFIKDIDDYLKKERELYFTIDELPFVKTYNENEIADFINKNDLNDYNAKINSFNNKITLYEDGRATQKISEYIEKIVEGSNS